MTYLTEPDVARRWKVDPETVRRLRLAGKLRHFRPTVSKAVRYRLEDIERYEADHMTDAHPIGMKRKGAVR